MERSAIRVGRRCFLGRHHAGLLPPLALVAFSPVHVSTSLVAWLSSCSNESHDSLKCGRDSYADIYLQVVRIATGDSSLCAPHLEPLVCAKYLPWPSSTVPGNIIRATIYSKAKGRLAISQDSWLLRIWYIRFNMPYGTGGTYNSKRIFPNRAWRF